MTAERTGNRKCWHLVNARGERVTRGTQGERYTRSVAEAHARAVGGGVRACLDGHHFEPCPGEAHSNLHIDHCGLCASRWGVIMVADGPKALEPEKRHDPLDKHGPARST